MRRVAITGPGSRFEHRTFGSGFPDLIAHRPRRYPPARPIRLLRASFLSKAAQALGYTATDHFEPKQADMIDRFAQFALVAARQALRDAAVDWTPRLAGKYGCDYRFMRGWAKRAGAGLRGPLQVQ